MSAEVMATVLSAAAVLLGVWRLVNAVESRIGARLDALDKRVTAQIGEVNRRIDAVLLADRDASRRAS